MSDYKYKYPHIPNLITMKPTPRILLGQRLCWTEKKDGSCIAIWKGKRKVHIGSHNLEKASSDLVALVKGTEEYEKVLKILEDNPELVIYVEACRKGRSITGIEVYDKDFLICFDMFNTSTGQFLPYVLVHQYCYHRDMPIVKLYAETRHRSMKDLLKFKNHVLEYCEALKLEGMVIKAYKIPDKIVEYYKEYGKGLIQAKVKLDIPEPVKRKITKGNPIYPPIPEVDIMGAIDKVWQELGTEQFKDVKVAMPKIAMEVGEECSKHLYSKPSGKLFSYYQKYLEKLIV